MSAQELELPAAGLPAARRRRLPGPARWRALLEQRWKDRLQEVTQLSVEFHEAGAAVLEPRQPQSMRTLMRRAVTARRQLADLDDALGRLATGDYGRCERCRRDIPAETLTRAPEQRYCPRCG